jgi:hypothetical protein
MEDRPEYGSSVVPHEAYMHVGRVQYIQYAGDNRKQFEKSATTWIIYPSFLQGTIVLGNRRLEEELRRATADDARHKEPHE